MDALARCCKGGNEDAAGRQLWDNRAAFVLAAIGSAVGLGNIWRFPSLSFRYGGGAFFIPYLLALFFIGIPLLILEFSLGQVFRSGDIVSFGSIHKRLRGVGLASVFSAFMIVCYYTLIIAWAVVYAVNSFSNPVPWTQEFAIETVTREFYETNTLIDAESTAAALNFTLYSDPRSSICPVCKQCDLKSDYQQAASYFYGPLIELQTDDTFDQLIGGRLVVSTMVAMVFVWAVIFISIYRGPSFTSKVVYVTMPLPVIMLIILFFVGISLDGSGDGIDAYIGQWKVETLDALAWSEAVAQIFFSLGVTFGIMTAYASYNNPNQNTVVDAFIVSLSNSMVSFISGFAVFATIGHVSKTEGLPFDKIDIAGPALVFVAYPVGLSKFGGASAGFLCFLFFSTLFFLGIDSAFSLVEAVSTGLHDSRKYGKMVTRGQITLILTVIGLLIGTLYAADTGLYLLDVVDYYINNVTMVFVGFMECYAVGYLVHLQEQTEHVGFASVIALQVGLFGGAFLGPLIAMINWSDVVDCAECATNTTGVCRQINELQDACEVGLGEYICWPQVDGACPIGTELCRANNEWEAGLATALIFAFVFVVLSLILAITHRGKYAGESAGTRLWWLLLSNTEDFRTLINEVVATKGATKVPLVWGLCIKFVIPPVLVIILTITCISNIKAPYGGYSGGMQAAGVGTALFGVSMALYCMIYPELLDSMMPEGHQVLSREAALAAAGSNAIKGGKSGKSGKSGKKASDDDEEVDSEVDSEEAGTGYESS